MGYDNGHITISFRTSAHNSEQDGIDKRAVTALRRAIIEMVDDIDEFRRVVVDISGGDLTGP